MTDYEKIIKELDGADLFLRNRVDAKPAQLNEYDVEALLDISKVCDEAARIIEKLTSPKLIMNTDYVLSKEEIIEAMQSSHIQIIPCNKTTIKKEILEDFVLEAKWKAWYDSDYEDYLLTKDDLEDVKNKMMGEE